MDLGGGEGMMLLSAALAYAAACDPAAALARLREAGEREDYMCVVEAEEGAELLQAALLPGGGDDRVPGGGGERLTRALALWLLERTDRPMDPAVVDKLSPGDRRLLADGIRARRGRASPSPEHARVFAQFAWYEPVATYTDARLRPVDRENLKIVDPPVRLAPPPAPAPEPEEAAPVEGGERPEAPPLLQALCGCDASGAAAGPGLAMAGALAAFASAAVARLRRR